MIDFDVGKLNKRITIQEVNEIADGEGGFTEEWSDVGVYWAEVKPMVAKQIFEYRSLNVHATHKIRVYANVPINESNRIIFNSRIFEVLTVENENEANVVKWTTCKEMRN